MRKTKSIADLMEEWIGRLERAEYKAGSIADSLDFLAACVKRGGDYYANRDLSRKAKAH